MFMKNNISRGEKFLSIKIIYTVFFLPNEIANKNASMSTHVKCVHGCEVGCMS